MAVLAALDAFAATGSRARAHRALHAIAIVIGGALAALCGCTAISFVPQPAAQQAADSVIGDIWPTAPAGAGKSPDLIVNTEAVTVIRNSMATRYQALKPHLDAGAIGLTSDGLMAMRDFNQVAALARAEVILQIADENKDRNTLYREIARANGHPDWALELRAAFSERWIDRAQTGWYYRNELGVWMRKP